MQLLYRQYDVKKWFHFPASVWGDFDDFHSLAISHVGCTKWVRWERWHVFGDTVYIFLLCSVLSLVNYTSVCVWQSCSPLSCVVSCDVSCRLFCCVSSWFLILSVFASLLILCSNRYIFCFRVNFIIGDCWWCPTDFIFSSRKVTIGSQVVASVPHNIRLFKSGHAAHRRHNAAFMILHTCSGTKFLISALTMAASFDYFRNRSIHANNRLQSIYQISK